MNPATPILDPIRGDRIHFLRQVIGRPLPKPGDQAVWPSRCGRHLFAEFRTFGEIDKHKTCRRCLTTGL